MLMAHAHITPNKITLKEWKAQFTVGRTLHCVNHWIARHVGKSRRIVKSQGNGYFYRDGSSFKPDGTEERFWSPFPLRSEIEIHEDGSFTCRPKDGIERGVFWTLKFVD